MSLNTFRFFKTFCHTCVLYCLSLPSQGTLDDDIDWNSLFCNLSFFSYTRILKNAIGELTWQRHVVSWSWLTVFVFTLSDITPHCHFINQSRIENRSKSLFYYPLMTDKPQSRTQQKRKEKSEMILGFPPLFGFVVREKSAISSANSMLVNPHRHIASHLAV